MVKNRKTLLRIVSLVLICLIMVVSVLPYNAMALGRTFLSDDVGTKLRPTMAGKYLVVTNKQNEVFPESGYLCVTGDFADVGKFADALMDVSFSDSVGYGSASNICADHRGMGYTSMIATDADGNEIPYQRYKEKFVFGDENADLMELRDVYLTFEPIAGLWDANEINRLVWLHGQDQPIRFECSAVIWFVADGKLTSEYLYTYGDTSGDQSPLFVRYMDEIATRYGIKAGDPYMITDLSIHIYDYEFATLNSFTISRSASVFGDMTGNDGAEWPVTEWPPQSESVADFMAYVADSTGMSSGGNGGGSVVIPPSSTGSSTSATLLTTTFTEFLIDAATGFFDAELIPGISMGAIFITVLIMAVVVGVIKLFL